ncbi:MAG: ATP-binding protein [Muribaculaceae bacterium]|nr:ATP-binding protein [Muribaculaceae bacterium]
MDTSVLLEILRDQREELALLRSQWFCERKEESMIKLESKKAQVVIGVRRSGKSTLCFNALTKAHVKFAYVNFDDERLIHLSADDLNEILKCLYQIYGDFTHLFLDEAQNINGWHLFVNRLLRQGMKVIITGSNAKLLSSELSTYLTGRYNEIELLPFSFREFCEVEGVTTTELTTKTDALLRRAFDKYMDTGGFPEIISGEENAEIYIDTLVSNILNRDIVQRFKVRYKDTFKSLAHHLMNNAPCEVIYTALQKTFNLKNDKTVENYVGYLYQAYLMRQLRKYSTKSSDRIRNAKCYPIDVSLMNARKNAFAKDNFGWRLETLVYLALCRKYGIGYDIYYHKTDSYEVDFVVCHRATVTELVQVSYDVSSEKTFNRECSALIKAGKSLNCDKLTLVTAFEERVLETQGQVINVCAAYKWLLL